MSTNKIVSGSSKTRAGYIAGRIIVFVGLKDLAVEAVFGSQPIPVMKYLSSYLCLTNQLVNQVAEQARGKYGFKVNAFTGKKADYERGAKTEYLNGESVAVTSYSGLQQ